MIEHTLADEAKTEELNILEYREAREIRFLSRNSVKRCLYYTANVLTLCLNMLIFHWLELHSILYDVEEDFDDASDLLVITTEDNWIIVPIKNGSFDILPLNEEDQFWDSKSKVSQQDSGSQKNEQKLIKYLERKEKGELGSLGESNFLEGEFSSTLKENKGNETGTVTGNVTVTRNVLGLSEDLSNPRNEELIRNKGSVQKRVIHFNHRKYYFNRNISTFIPLETVFATHVLKRPGLIREVYHYGNTVELSNKLEGTFEKNNLDIENNVLLYDILTSLVHPMNFGIFMLVIVCYVCNKMAEALGKLI